MLSGRLDPRRPTRPRYGRRLGCGGHHPLADKGWTTRKNAHGDTEWIPPPHLDRGRPRTNTYWHPEKLLHNEDGDNGDDDEDTSSGAA
jgi:hypothetical protein